MIAFLRANTGRQRSRPPEVVADGFENLHGTDPGVVERILQLSAGVRGGRCAAVYGSPALVQPETGGIFAFGAGTFYCLRLPPALVSQAVQAGALLRYKWSFGGEMDVRVELVDEWVGGRWLE